MSRSQYPGPRSPAPPRLPPPTAQPPAQQPAKPAAHAPPPPRRPPGYRPSRALSSSTPSWCSQILRAASRPNLTVCTARFTLLAVSECPTTTSDARAAAKGMRLACVGCKPKRTTGERRWGRRIELRLSVILYRSSGRRRRRRQGVVCGWAVRAAWAVWAAWAVCRRCGQGWAIQNTA